MNAIATTIAELRVLVAYLGEKGQANWWGSEFFSTTAAAFLAPMFNRSLFLAQYQGATAAAAKVHDEAIGVGRIYHLFRLPIGLEQASSDALNDAAFVQTVQARLANRDLALERLAELAKKPESVSPGPMSLGQMSQDLRAELQRAAGFYFSALSTGIQTFPYVRQQGLGLLTLETILKVLDEWGAINGDAIVKCQAQILGERALTRAIEARHPDADFIFSTNIHGGFHLEQEILELLVDAVGNHIFGDFRFQARFL